MFKKRKINEYDFEKEEKEHLRSPAYAFCRCLGYDYEHSVKIGRIIVENQREDEVFSDTYIRLGIRGIYERL